MEAQSAALQAETEWPVHAGGRALLCAVPATALPPRRPPEDCPQSLVPPGDLCQGIAVSAARLRAAARAAAAKATWSPTATAGAWRWTAVSGAIASDICELLLTAIARLPAGPGIPPPGHALAAAEAMAAARAAWQAAAGSWQRVSTENPSSVSLAMNEAGDLITRLGRLAFGDPAWTPRRAGRGGTAAPPPQGAAVPGILAALHETAETFADLAAADLAGIGAAWRASRFYAPRQRPQRGVHGRPRLFAPASALQVAAVTGAYRTAAAAACGAAAAMGAIARVMDLPTLPLALARALDDLAPAAVPPPAAGPVELMVAAVTADRRLLSRAVALDRAVLALSAEAAASAFPGPTAALPAGLAARRAFRQALAAEMRILRGAAGMTQRQLAVAARVSTNSIVDIENAHGSRAPAVVRRAAAAAGAPPDAVTRLGALAEAAAPRTPQPGGNGGPAPGYKPRLPQGGGAL
jgi:hypothetical protein